MHPALANYFKIYTKEAAPFMHQQLEEWKITKPLAGLRVVHHVPLVPNTLLKIACLIAGGAEVTVTNPSSFMTAHPEAVDCLKQAGIRYTENLSQLRSETFDLYFDCGAELYQALGKPGIGAIELTGSGDLIYRNQELDFPVISIDHSLTKQLETVFGCADSCHSAISQLLGINTVNKSWLIFGFGKIGRGVAYFCAQNKAAVVAVDICENQRRSARQLGIEAINPLDKQTLHQAIQNAEIIVTATGSKAIMNAYPHDWFSGKILANMGVYDEYGAGFGEEEVLNQKKPVNFVLNDPTPMKYIDPEFYIHNIAALTLLSENLSQGVHGPTKDLDNRIIEDWCKYHSFHLEIINKWFVNYI
ncbi:NAD-binding protein [Legionella sp. 16cNR16C]|uniref:NAD-binding protein n=1 Tax=Legionella sp. 16cNR16C TaxID=2905656 RepID=UPI001E3B9736|nr:NAD-binding protein [Legionella sp. 16cNR16C]MCE3044806.1 NAD-binding protein [Legionella sp. 16cNR16C]